MSLARNLSKFKPSSSGLVETADIADDAINSDKIADNAVANAQLADNAVGTNEIANDAVTTAKVNPAQTDITSVGTLTGLATSGNVGIGSSADANAKLLLIDNHTTAVTNSSTLLANTTLAINGNQSQGSDNLRIGAIASAGSYFMEVTNSAANAAYALCLNPINKGNVGIGTTSPSAPLHIVGEGNTGQRVHVGSSSAHQIYLGNTAGISSVGTLTNQNFQLITNGSGRLTVGTGGDVTIADGNLVVANGHGIDFSAKSGDASGMNAELFDDYEEGLWDATLTPQTSGSVTVAGGTDACQYTKIGRMVFLSGMISIGSVSSPSGVLRMSGLPFAVANLNDYGGRTLATINIQAGAIPPNNYGMWFSEGDSYGSIYNFTDAEQPQSGASNNFSGNESIYFSVMYRTT